ncbi:MAG: DUF2851 family protein [Chitinophagaceae bacterium]
MTDEYFMHSLWQYSLYRPEALRTTLGEPLTIINPGIRNRHSGPDFEEARIRIGNTMLVGHVELHIRASDWFAHGHQRDKAYERIILHVVWEDDAPGSLPESIPVLVLAPHVPAAIITRYRFLHESLSGIPCGHMLGNVNNLVKKAWLTRLLAERWESRFRAWDTLLQQTNGDWRMLLYWRMAENFGFRTNAAPFLQLAQSIPLVILGRHHDQLFQLEALLFGQAGFLSEEFNEEYPFRLRQEYEYLRRKYRLEPMPVHLWKFMRLRPANFPTIRIAQFAALVHQSFHLFQQIVAQSDLKELTALFEGISASEYWDGHFRFGDQEQQKPRSRSLGGDSIANIITNTVAPVRFMYGAQHESDDYVAQSIALLEGLEPERNAVISEWEQRGWKPDNAAESQALLELYHHYCSRKQCLNCSVGQSLLRLWPDK